MRLIGRVAVIGVNVGDDRAEVDAFANGLGVGYPMFTDPDGLRYRIPFNTAMDGNTVEMSVEQAHYGKAAAEYQATLSFLESRIGGIRKALRGE